MKKNYLLIGLILPLFLCAMDNPGVMKCLTPSIVKQFSVPEVYSMTYTPDGKKFLVSQYLNTTIRITPYNVLDYTPQTNEHGKVHTVDLPANAGILAVTPDSKEVVISVAENNTLTKVNLETRQEQSMCTQTVQAQSAQYSADGKSLLITIDGGVEVLHLHHPRENAAGIFEENKIYNVAWNPANPWQVGMVMSDSSTNPAQWSLWDIRTKAPQNLVQVPIQATTNVQFNNAGTQLICGASGQVVVCNTAKAAALAYYSLNGKKSDKPYPVATTDTLLSPVVVPGAGTRMFFGDVADKIIFLDVEDSQNSFAYEPLPEGYFWGPILALSPDGKQMAATNYLGGKDKSQMQILDVSAYMQEKKEQVAQKVEAIAKNLTDDASQTKKVEAAAGRKCLII